jgi:hypothetical protein
MPKLRDDPEPTSNSTLRLDPRDRRLLREHAHIRNVRMAVLERDIIRGWLSAVTDWEHPYFSRPVLGFGPLDGVPNRYPGYVASLGFREPGFEGTTLGPTTDSGSAPDHLNHRQEIDADSPLIADPQEIERILRKNGKT